MAYVFEQIDTLSEWSRVVRKWKRPRGSLPAISALPKAQLVNRVVCVYGRNADTRERDIGLVKPAGSSTPREGTYTWVSGVAKLIPAKA